MSKYPNLEHVARTYFGYTDLNADVFTYYFFCDESDFEDETYLNAFVRDFPGTFPYFRFFDLGYSNLDEFIELVIACFVFAEDDFTLAPLNLNQFQAVSAFEKLWLSSRFAETRLEFFFRALSSMHPTYVFSDHPDRFRNYENALRSIRQEMREFKPVHLTEDNALFRFDDFSEFIRECKLRSEEYSFD